MYTTQCASFDGCKSTIPTSYANDPPLRYILTLSNPKKERTW